MEKSYDKYYVKKNPATNEIMEKDGEPVLQELAKKRCRLEPRHIKVLNRGWRNSGVYFKESKDDVKKDEKTEARLALEKEATDLEIKFRADISDEKLQEKINEAKK